MRPYYGLSFILLLSRHFFLPVIYVIVTVWDTLLLTQKQTNKNLENESALRFLTIIS